MIKLNENDRILFIGDSITDVDFNKQQDSTIGGKNVYSLQVCEELKKRYKNLEFFYKGIASNRSYHVYDRLTQDCISLKPNVIVMLIGVNDAWENYVPEEYPPLLRPFEPHMKEIFRRIKAELPETKLITMLPFLIDTIPEKEPFHKVLDIYRDNLKSYAQGNTDEIIDLQAVFNEAQKNNKSYDLAHDGIHPTDFGHSKIAEAILKVLE